MGATTNERASGKNKTKKKEMGVYACVCVRVSFYRTFVVYGKCFLFDQQLNVQKAGINI